MKKKPKPKSKKTPKLVSSGPPQPRFLEQMIVKQGRMR